jgi:beta-glucanase (GH16 family)
VRKLLLAAFAAVVAAVALLAMADKHHPTNTAPDSGAAAPPAQGWSSSTGWRPVWGVDVTSNRPSWRQWQWFVGNTGPTNRATYTANIANSYVTGDTLTLRVTRSSRGWESARLQSRQAFAPPEGGSLKVSVDVRMPDGSNPSNGYFPAVWLLGANWQSVGWPLSGEIDLAEGVPAKNVLIGAVHCGIESGGPCHEPTGILRHVTLTPGWHHYEVVLNTNPKRLVWSMDRARTGERTFELTPRIIGARVWDETFGHPYNLIANIAMGGPLAGSSDHASPGREMQIRNLTVSVNRNGAAR